MRFALVITCPRWLKRHCPRPRGSRSPEATVNGLLQAGLLGKLALCTTQSPASSLNLPAPSQCADGRNRFQTSRFGF